MSEAQDVQKDLIDNLIEKYFSDSDFSVVEVTKKGEKTNKIIEIFVDRSEPFFIDDIAALNRGVNELFDNQYAENDISKITVSSPGAEKPYRFFWQLNKHIGRTMEIMMADETFLTGKLVGLNPEGEILELEIRDEKKKSVVHNTQIEFKNISEIKAKLLFK